MELDELKKKWNELNDKFPRKPITDERQIAELIARCKSGTRKSLRNLIGIQRFSLGINILAIGCCLAIGWNLHDSIADEETRIKAYALLAFLCITLLGAFWWDYKTYNWTHGTRVDEMPVAEVSRRMVVLRQWTRREIWFIGLWVPCFDVLYCWVVGLFALPLWAVSGILLLLLLIQAPLLYLFYKKAVYRHLDNIKANIEELKDACTE